MDVSRILPNLSVGSYPGSPEDIDRLKRDFGVTAVLNAQTDDDMAIWDVNWYRLETAARLNVLTALLVVVGLLQVAVLAFQVWGK